MEVIESEDRVASLDLQQQLCRSQLIVKIQCGRSVRLAYRVQVLVNLGALFFE
jgi:hypothetical protein